MRLPNQQSLARLKRIDRPGIWQFLFGFSLSLMFLAGCAGGTSGKSWFSGVFSGASPTPSPAAAPTPIAKASPIPSPAAAEMPGSGGKKAARQARAASENAATASKEAASASAAAALASKQAASAANRIGGTGPTNADVSLENSSGTTVSANPVGAIRNGATPAASPSLMTSARDASPRRTAPTPSSLAPEERETSGESYLVRAAKRIRNADRMDKPVDPKT